MFDERESVVKMAESASAESSGRGSDADDKQAGNRADAAQKTGVTFCFGSAGWLFVYYLGVIKRIKELELHRNARYISCSGGALACCAGFCCDVDMDELKDFVLQSAVEARSSIAGPFRLRQYTLGAIEKFSSAKDLPNISGKMEASVTVLPFMRNVRLSEFKDYDFLKQVLLASSCLVPLAGGPVHVEGLGWCVDGALSDLQLLKGLSVGGTFSKIHNDVAECEATVTVCPFYCSRADIKPSRYIPPWWAFMPPSQKELEGVYNLGYTDTRDWLLARVDTAPEESWTESVYRRSAELMKEAGLTAASQRQYLEEYLNSNIPRIPTERLPNISHHLPSLRSRLPRMPSMEMPNLEMISLGLSCQLSEHLPAVPNLPEMPVLPQLPQCLSEMVRGGQRGFKPLPGLLLLFLRQILVFVTAILVYTELFWNALIWGTLATVAITFAMDVRPVPNVPRVGHESSAGDLFYAADRALRQPAQEGLGEPVTHLPVAKLCASGNIGVTGSSSSGC